MKNTIQIPDVMTAHCTDKNKDVEVLFISQHGDTIRATYETIPLMFKRTKPGIYVANMAGLEFVIKL